MSFQDFRRSAHRFTPRDIGYLSLAIIAVLLVLAALAAGNYYLAGILPEAGEFTLLRVGGRSFLFDRIEPYTAGVPNSVQRQVYDRAALPGENAYILDIPFHLMPVFFPLAAIPDDLIARTVWMVLIEFALFGLIYFGFRLMGRQIPQVITAIIFIFSYASLYAYISFLEGSPAILLGLAYLGMLVALRTGFDELVGGLLVITAFQWELGWLFLLFIIYSVVRARRWRVFYGAAMLAFVLFTISFFLYPGWIIPFMRAAWTSFRLDFGFSFHEILGGIWPEYGATFGRVLTAALLVSLGAEWSAARDVNSHRFIWAAFLTIVITPLMGHHVQMDHLVLLCLPLMLVIAVAFERWRKFGGLVGILLVVFYFGIPWLVFLLGPPDWIDLPKEVFLFLFWPLTGVIGMYWMRWWIIRPPRTWMDSLGGGGL